MPGASASPAVAKRTLVPEQRTAVSRDERERPGRARWRNRRRDIVESTI
jgi:hypothetical protein